MNKVIKATSLLFILIVLLLSVIGCNGETKNDKIDEIIEANVKLNGTWKSQSVSYNHEENKYTGIIELRFNDNQMQIVAPHGTSKIHDYTRNGITITITDPYVSEDNPNRKLSLGLEFSTNGFSVNMGGLKFTAGLSNTKLTFTKTAESAEIKEPEPAVEPPKEDNGTTPDEPPKEDTGTTPDEPSTGDPGSSEDTPIFVIEGTTITGLTDYGKTLSTITIPDSVTDIGFEAFINCNNIIY